MPNNNNKIMLKYRKHDYHKFRTKKKTFSKLKHKYRAQVRQIDNRRWNHNLGFVSQEADYLPLRHPQEKIAVQGSYASNLRILQ